MQSLRKETEDTRFLLNDKNRANNDVKGDISSLREQIARREAEIFATQRDVQQKTDTAYQIRKDNEAASYELQKLKEERARDQLEIDRLRDLCAFKERENGEADQRIKASDYDLFKMSERAAELAKIADQRDFDLRRTSETFDGARRDLLAARDEL
jgi:chromosome segregation ATPase